MQVAPEEVGLSPPKFGRIKNSEGLLPPSLWENDPVLCQQHNVLSPLSCRSSLKTITLQHQELTIHTIVFLGNFVPLHGQCCISKSVLLALLCMTLDVSSQAAHTLALSSASRQRLKEVRLVDLGQFCFPEISPLILTILSN